MTIGINGYEAVISRFGYGQKSGLPRRVGSGEYCYQLLVNLHKIDKENAYIIYLPQYPTRDLPKESSTWHYKIVKPRKLWTIIGLSLEFLFRRSKPDVFLSPTHYLPIFTPNCSMISILDTSYIHFPELFKSNDLNQLTKWTKYSAKKAKSIFTISQASKDDIIKAYGVPESRVVVTYPGIKSETNSPARNATPARQSPDGSSQMADGQSVAGGKFKMQNSKLLKDKYGVEGQYILFVGTLQPRKNIVRLVEAFSKLNKPNLDLVIVGKKGWKFEEILTAPEKFGVENKVKFLESVTDEDLAAFYRNAVCFVLPSLYEGFGLPVLEAMRYGCPVVTSNVSSLPEAGGEAALYVDPQDADDIKKKLELMINDKGLRIKLIEKGYEQVKKFSWEKTARETLNTLESIKQQV